MGLHRAILLAVVAMMAAGCAATSTTGSSQVQLHKQGQAAPSRPYQLGIGDRIRLIAPTIPEWSDLEAAVREDGTIRLPLLGEMFAAGRTPAQLGSELEEKLARYYVKPQVQVRVTVYQARRWFAESGDVRVAMPYTGHDQPTDALKVLNRGGRVRFNVWRADESGRFYLVKLEDQPLEPGDVVRLGGGGLALGERSAR